MENPFLSVIIPTFNEETQIASTLSKIIDYLGKQPFLWEIIVVDDGSSDATSDVVEDYTKNYSMVRLETIKHKGKGQAVKHGMLNSTGIYRFTCDADLAMPIEQLDRFLPNMDKGYDVVIGSRQISGARRFNEPTLRHVMGRVFNSIVSVLAISGFQDTQCGFKCFRGKIADELFPLIMTEGFGFDVEILYLAVKRNLNILEVPIDWHHRTASKVRNATDSLLMLWETILIRWRNLHGHYEANFSFAHSMPDSRSGDQAFHSNQENLVAVVMPTYNEAKNLREATHRIFAQKIPNLYIIVVDDNSTDDTYQIVRELSEKFPGKLHFIHRRTKQGLGTAYIEGFSQALTAKANYIFQMDADLSHSPEYIPAFLEMLNHADVVIGSRYVPEGGYDPNWNLGRRLLSQLANLSIRLVTGLKIKDVTSGFKAFRRNALKSLDLNQLKCRGFGFQVEVTHACQRRKHIIVEYPIIFVARKEGHSKMSLSIILEAAWCFIGLRWKR